LFSETTSRVPTSSLSPLIGGGTDGTRSVRRVKVGTKSFPYGTKSGRSGTKSLGRSGAPRPGPRPEGVSEEGRDEVVGRSRFQGGRKQLGDARHQGESNECCGSSFRAEMSHGRTMCNPLFTVRDEEVASYLPSRMSQALSPEWFRGEARKRCRAWGAGLLLPAGAKSPSRRGLEPRSQGQFLGPDPVGRPSRPGRVPRYATKPAAGRGKADTMSHLIDYLAPEQIREARRRGIDPERVARAAIERDLHAQGETPEVIRRSVRAMAARRTRTRRAATCPGCGVRLAVELGRGPRVMLDANRDRFSWLRNAATGGGRAGGDCPHCGTPLVFEHGRVLNAARKVMA